MYISSYNDSWNQFLELHEKIGNNRLKFAESIGTVTDNLFTLLKNTERSRKQVIIEIKKETNNNSI